MLHKRRLASYAPKG
ncbi:hok/gef family protein, partial [Escherichia coli 5905]